MKNARPVLLDVVVTDPDFWDELVACYVGMEKDEFLYLVRIEDVSDYAEPSHYYQIAIKDIPNYDFDDDHNNLYAEHFLTPTSVDIGLFPEINACAKIMKERH